MPGGTERETDGSDCISRRAASGAWGDGAGRLTGQTASPGGQRPEPGETERETDGSDCISRRAASGAWRGRSGRLTDQTASPGGQRPEPGGDGAGD